MIELVVMVTQLNVMVTQLAAMVTQSHHTSVDYCVSA